MGHEVLKAVATRWSGQRDEFARDKAEVEAENFTPLLVAYSMPGLCHVGKASEIVSFESKQRAQRRNQSFHSCLRPCLGTAFLI